MEERKRKDLFMYMEVPILLCSPYTLGLLPLCDTPSGEPTRMGTSPTTFTYPTPKDPQEKEHFAPPFIPGPVDPKW